MEGIIATEKYVQSLPYKTLEKTDSLNPTLFLWLLTMQSESRNYCTMYRRFLSRCPRPPPDMLPNKASTFNTHEKSYKHPYSMQYSWLMQLLKLWLSCWHWTIIFIVHRYYILLGIDQIDKEISSLSFKEIFFLSLFASIIANNIVYDVQNVFIKFYFSLPDYSITFLVSD